MDGLFLNFVSVFACVALHGPEAGMGLGAHDRLVMYLMMESFVCADVLI